MKIATCQERLNELFDSDPRNDSAIAAALGVAKQTLSAWRNGSRSPKKTMLIKITEEFHVSIEWLMGFDVDKDMSRVPTALQGATVFFCCHCKTSVSPYFPTLTSFFETSNYCLLLDVIVGCYTVRYTQKKPRISPGPCCG